MSVNMSVNKQNKNLTRGFTLMEMLISIAIFAVCIGIASGAFIRGLRSQRAIVSLIAANDNISIALEQMLREIRTGYQFSTTTPVELVFFNANNVLVSYRLENGAIERGIEEPPGSTVFVYRPITGDNVIITRFNIGLFGNTFGDGFPPRITLSISITPNSSYLSNVSVDIQSTVSARFIDT